MPAAEIEVACTPSNVVSSDEMPSMLAAETDLACPPSNAVPPDETPSTPAAEEADFRFPPPVSFFSVYYIVEVVLILLTTFICMHAFMHWCQYEVRNFSEIEEEASSFAKENCIVADLYVQNGGFGPSYV